MNNIVFEPKVYLVGKQKVVRDELQKFLNNNDAAGWTSDAPSAGEELAEIHGRTCFDEETEIMTNEGWKKYQEINENSLLLTLNKDTKQTEYQKPQKVNIYDYDGEMFEVNKRDINFLVTPEHRQYVSILEKNKWSDFEFKETKDILNKTTKIFLKSFGNKEDGFVPDQIVVEDVKYQNNGNDRISEGFTFSGKENVLAFLELCCHFVCNGSTGKKIEKRTKKDSGYKIIIYGREKDRVLEICNLLKLPASVYIDKRNNCPRVTIAIKKSLFHWIMDNLGGINKDKRMPKEVLSLPKENLLDIWKLLVRADGSMTKNGQELFITSSKIMSNQVQLILSKLGFGYSVKLIKGKNLDCDVIRKKNSEICKISPNDFNKISYKGKVFCPSTENGIVFVKRKGLCHFSGNCYMSYKKPRPGGNSKYIEHIKETAHGSVLEGAVYTFIFENVSRSLSLELIRHRTISPSQLSQRYVDESDTLFCVPPDLSDEVKLAQDMMWSIDLEADLKSEKDTFSAKYVAKYGVNAALKAIEIGNLWIDAVESQKECYIKLVDYLSQKENNLSGTDKRKFARQAARSILGNATETKIVMTGNARAWRNFIELRANRHADPEIRVLAYMVWQKLNEESPNLFGDYKEEKLDDGTFELTTPYRKV